MHVYVIAPLGMYGTLAPLVPQESLAVLYHSPVSRKQVLGNGCRHAIGNIHVMLTCVTSYDQNRRQVGLLCGVGRVGKPLAR